MVEGDGPELTCLYGSHSKAQRMCHDHDAVCTNRSGALMSVKFASRACLGGMFGTFLLAVAGCASSAPPVDPSLIQASQPGGNPERPAFYVQWQAGGLPGLTQRPSLDRSSRLPDYPNS